MKTGDLGKREEYNALIISLMRNWTFSLGEYMKAPELVLDEAVRLVPNGDAHRQDVGSCLEFLFWKRVNESVCWIPFPEPVLNGDTLRVYYDGKEYKSIVRFRRHDMEIILEDSHLPLRRTASLPDCSDVTFTDYNGESCSQYGLLKAKEMILALVLENHYLRKN